MHALAARLMVDGTGRATSCKYRVGIMISDLI